MQERQPEASMGERESRTVGYDIPKGRVFIRTRCTEQFVAGLDIDDGIGLFFHYRKGSGRDQQKVLCNIAQTPDGNVVLAYTEQGLIVGYIALHPVSSVLRWGQGDTTGYYEFGAIEVSRAWRGTGLAKRLIDTAFADEWLEDKIVLSYELSWHWDLDGTGISKRQYRQLLYSLLSRAGFKEYPTDEGNIRMDLYNLFTARIGKRASAELREKFLRSLFASDQPESMWPAHW